MTKKKETARERQRKEDCTRLTENKIRLRMSGERNETENDKERKTPI